MCGPTSSLAVLFSKPSLLQLKAVSHCPSLLLGRTPLNHRCPYLVKPFRVLAEWLGWRGSSTRQWMMSLAVLRSRCLSPGRTAYQRGSERQFIHFSPSGESEATVWSFDRRGVSETLRLIKLRSI
jgi:hypothetical protein